VRSEEHRADALRPEIVLVSLPLGQRGHGGAPAPLQGLELSQLAGFHGLHTHVPRTCGLVWLIEGAHVGAPSSTFGRLWLCSRGMRRTSYIE
jgi:hypothetical protein